MFFPKTQKIKELAEQYNHRIKELEGIFSKSTNIYIDYANVRPWATKLGWHVELKRLKQFLDSFDTVHTVKIYSGTLTGNKESEEQGKEMQKLGYTVITKPVKVMRKSIDVSSISPSSPDILKNFIRQSLLQKLKVETVEYLNRQLKELNDQGIFYIEDRKCNFDVEIGRDMLVDYAQNGIDHFILWSGDSDFASSVEQLLEDGKKVYIFATARKVASELNELVHKGLTIFDIQKIRNFICWGREIKIS
ncbi:MAG TPA: NYN domain-containing protein [Patescibacteria group bacterium]|nr:NYN domain-containing protein [Patescibacteria group bacterium]